MLRIDLLRSLPRSASSERPALPKRPKQSTSTTKGAPSGSPSPLKPILAVLLLLLAGGVTAVFLAKPDWLKVESIPSLWNPKGTAQSDSARHAEELNKKASHQIEARQDATVDWLTELESLLPVTQGFGGLTLSNMTYSSSGAFILEGSAMTAEALSAFQEAIVLVPGLDLSKSRAREDSIYGGRFSFRFEGRISSTEADTTAADSGDLEASDRDGSRVIAAQALSGQLDSLISTAAQNGISLSTSGSKKARVSRFGTFQAHSYRLKGVPSTTLGLGDSAVIANLRTLVYQERLRGSPFAFQRVIITERSDSRAVFLDILALTP